VAIAIAKKRQGPRLLPTAGNKSTKCFLGYQLKLPLRIVYLYRWFTQNYKNWKTPQSNLKKQTPKNLALKG